MIILKIMKLLKKNYEKAIELNPNQYKTLHNLAVLCYYNLNDKESANYYFAQAISINKEAVITRKELGKTIEKIPFVTKIEIKKLRHITDLNIEIDKNEKKHIILTGAKW